MLSNSNNKNELGGACGTYEREKEREGGDYTVWVGKPEGKKPLSKHRKIIVK
jgi:hypothetical protein